MESSATVHLSMLTSSIFSQCNCYETTNLMEYIEHVDVLSLTHPLDTKSTHWELKEFSLISAYMSFGLK